MEHNTYHHISFSSHSCFIYKHTHISVNLSTRINRYTGRQTVEKLSSVSLCDLVYSVTVRRVATAYTVVIFRSVNFFIVLIQKLVNKHQ